MELSKNLEKNVKINDEQPAYIELTNEVGFDDNTKEKIKVLEKFKIEEETAKTILEFQTGLINNIIRRQKHLSIEEIVKKLYSKYDFKSIVSEDKTEIWVKLNHVYKPVGKAIINAYTRHLCGNLYKENIAKEVISRINADMFIESEKFFKNITIETIVLNNGVLNLKTRDLSQDSEGQIHFNKHPVNYDANAKCPYIDKFFKDILETETDVQAMYELIGYTLYKDSFMEKATMLKGHTRNGKTKTLELISNFIGNENISKVSLQRLLKDKTALHMFHNKNANMCGDISGVPLDDVTQFKELVGRDSLTAFRKFKDDIDFKPFAKLIFATNTLPILTKDDSGFWTKWLFIEFPMTFVSESDYEEIKEQYNKKEITNEVFKKYKIKDPFIVDKLITPQELSGLLNKALDGLDNLLKNHDFIKNQSANSIHDTWARQSNSLVAFIEDKLERVRDSYITPEDLRTKYEEYCNDNDKEQLFKNVSKTMNQYAKSLFVMRGFVLPSEKERNAAKYWSNIKFKEEKESIPSKQKASEQKGFDAVFSMSLSIPFSKEEEENQTRLKKKDGGN
jgi:putative DNA primase/helicase